MVLDSKTLFGSLSSSSIDHHGEFKSFVECLERLYGIALTYPRFESHTQLKSFCTGMIEGDLTHPWKDAVACLSEQSKFGIAHSLFLFRKTLPGKKPLVEDYVRKMAAPQSPPDDDFKSFALRLTRKLFRPGWDRSYVDNCLTNTLPITSCSENSRKGGGCRGLDAQSRELRADFTSYVVKSVAPRHRGVSKVQAIDTGGKWRIIAIPPRVDNALRPLHKAMYSHLSRFPWLLRGDAKAARFKDFSPKRGEIFVSGDYESATDNLNADLQKAIMSELLGQSYTVPQGIKEHALSTYNSNLGLSGTNELFRQNRGQLMGQLTSFPMLCLINYITFRYSIRRPVPVRINGDDIVFRATPAEHKEWERNVIKGGLTLSLGKTMVHPRAFTLNSTPFWSVPKGAKLVGFVRPSAIFPRGDMSEKICSLNGRFYSACAGYGALRKSCVRELFLRSNERALHASRRSLTRGLGLDVDRRTLHATGMWFRELFYLEQIDEAPIPCLKPGIPVVGWKRVSRSWFSSQDEIQEWDGRWGAACVYHAWFSDLESSTLSEDFRMTRLREGCTPYGINTMNVPKILRMIKISRREMWLWINRRRCEHYFGKVRFRKGEGVWIEMDLIGARNRLNFVKSV